MAISSFWGQIPEVSTRKPTPISLLREQAEVLTTMTKGILVGEVVNENSDSQLGGMLRIVAPLLGGYSLPIIRVSHSIYVYPALLLNLLNQQEYICRNEDSYRVYLREILSSHEVHSILEALLAQSAA